MTRSYALASVAVLAAACSSTPTVIPTKNLDRPTDMGFACMGMVPADANGQVVLFGQGMDVCHPRGSVDPNITTDGQRTLGTFAFITNAGRGELAVVDMDRGRLLDLTPEAPGYGMLPVGGDPESLATSQDGSWVVTANRTSCDLSLVHTARLLTRTFSTNSSQAAPATDFLRRLVVRTGSGPDKALHASMGEIALLPSALTVGPRAVATFPGCDMVALLDLSFENSSASIVSAYYVRPDLPGGFQPAGREPSCPDDCAALPGSDSVEDGTDGGAENLDGGKVANIDGGTRRSALHLQPLALVPDGTRVYVGSLLDTALTSLDISDSLLGNPTRIELAENPGGVSRLRLGIDPFATDSTNSITGQFLPNRGKFLYAFASDDSIRVLSLDGAAPIECDVNIPASLNPDRLACLPVGTAGRRPLANGPGIRIPTFSNPDSPPPMPRDLAFANLQPVEGNANLHALSGQFGFVLASSGQVYVLNLDPKGEPDTAIHSFRETRDVGEASRTPIAVSIAPQRSVVQTDQAFATTATFSASDGPLIKPFATSNWTDFPDPDTIISRAWDVTWEGILPGASRGSGIVSSSGDGQSAGTIRDSGADFCASSVQTGDVLMFSGCTQDSDCQPDDEFSCQVSVSGARGMCLPKGNSSSAAIISRCARFMGSRMRYEIAKATPTSLTLQVKLDEVPKTTLNPCQQASDCRPDVDHGSLVSGSPDGGSKRAFDCVEVRKAEPRRCVERCDQDSDCRAGHVCESVPWLDASVGKLCVEAPLIDGGCFPQPMTTYSVRAGHAFMVYGSSMPKLRHGRVSADGTCQQDVSGDPSLVDRIPLSAPQCPAAFLDQCEKKNPDTGECAAWRLVQTLPAQAGRNPCLYQGVHNDGDTNGSPEAGTAGSEHVRAFFQDPQIRFVLTNLEEYAGDLLSIHFELQYGFIPLTVQIPSYEVLLTMGNRILTGPTKTPESPLRRGTGNTSYPYLYVVDQGRTALTPASRGQVLRINPRAGSNEIVTFDTTLSGSTPFQVQ
jgi:hypothetical protein